MEELAVRKLTTEEMQNQYGGFGLMALFVAVLPLLVQATSSVISSIRMLDSDNGHVKLKGYESSWTNNKEVAEKVKPKSFNYAY